MGLCRIHGPSSVVGKVLCSTPRHHRTRWPIERAALPSGSQRGWCSLSVGLLEMGGGIFSCCGNRKAWPDFSGNTMDNLSKRIIVLHKMLIAPRFDREIIVSSQNCTTVRRKKKWSVCWTAACQGFIWSLPLTNWADYRAQTEFKGGSSVCRIVPTVRQRVAPPHGVRQRVLYGEHNPCGTKYREYI